MVLYTSLKHHEDLHVWTIVMCSCLSTTAKDCINYKDMKSEKRINSVDQFFFKTNGPLNFHFFMMEVLPDTIHSLQPKKDVFMQISQMDHSGFIDAIWSTSFYLC